MGLIKDWVGGGRSLTGVRDEWRRDSESEAYRNVSLEFVDSSQAPNAIGLHLKISPD